MSNTFNERKVFIRVPILIPKFTNYLIKRAKLTASYHDVLVIDGDVFYQCIEG